MGRLKTAFEESFPVYRRQRGDRVHYCSLDLLRINHPAQFLAEMTSTRVIVGSVLTYVLAPAPTGNVRLREKSSLRHGVQEVAEGIGPNFVTLTVRLLDFHAVED